MSQCNPKRILIACPTLGLDPDPDRWLRSFTSILNQVRKLGMDHGCLFPYRLTWWPANNLIWDAAFDNKFDFILRIDDDIWNVPDNAVEKLLAADKAVIGAAYPNQRFPYMIQAVNRTEEGSLLDICKQDRMVLKSVVQEDPAVEVVPVDLIGFGMTLIRVADFKYFERPMYKGNEDVPDDSYFAQICLDNGIQQYVHFGVQLAHRHVTFFNNGYLFNADVIASSGNLPIPEELKSQMENNGGLENAKT